MCLIAHLRFDASHRAGMTDTKAPVPHARPPGHSIGKAGLLSGPVGLCGICLRRNSGSRLRISTAARDWCSASPRGQKHSFRRRAMFLVSAKQRHRRDAGIGQIFHQSSSSNAPASRPWAATISSCMTGIAPIVPPGMSADALDYFGNWAHRLRQTPARLARRFRASPQDKAALVRIYAGGLGLLRRDPDPADRLRPGVPGFPARRRDRLFRAQIIRPLCWAMACARSAISWPRTMRLAPAGFRRRPWRSTR